MPRKRDASGDVFQPENVGGVVVMDRKLTPEEAAAQDAERAAKLAAERSGRFGVAVDGDAQS